MNASALADREIVSHEEWLLSRKALLRREKELTRLHDQVCAERRALPWIEVGKDYVFDGPDGRVTLGDLFDGRNQLFVYHFMFGPDWDEGCPGCSFLCDHVDAARQHFQQADLSFVAVSRAPWPKIAPFKKRMGWNFNWVSSHGSDFNHDFHVSFTPEELASGRVFYNYAEIPADQANDELPGMSAFIRDADGTVFHTYSNYARGGEEMISTLMILDHATRGRNEKTTMDWVRRHDEYTDAPAAGACCHE